MFKKYFSWSLLALLLAAQGAVAELKIGVVDIQQALLASEEAQQFLETTQTDLRDDQEEFQGLQQEIQQLQEQMQKDAEVMSPAEQRRRSKQIEDKQIDARFLANKLQKEMQDRQQELMQQMGPKLEAAIQDLVEAEGYDLIMQRGNLVYAAATHNITAKVTEKLNEKRAASR